jgi:hypothetical protein
VLTAAAQRAKTQPPLTRFDAECAHRRGRQIATVAVARKLLARSLHVLNQIHATTSAEGQPAGCARSAACACNTAVSMTQAARPELPTSCRSSQPGGPNGCL